MSFFVPSSSGLAVRGRCRFWRLWTIFANVGRDLCGDGLSICQRVSEPDYPTFAVVIGGLAIGRVPYEPFGSSL